MQKRLSSALISVFYKDGLEPLVKELHKKNVVIYTTGGTQSFIEALGIPCVAVESITNYPSILGGRVKTLHPKIFGGILGRRMVEQDMQEMQEYEIPEIDLVIVDLYPFEETLASTNEEHLIIEKIDIGGPSMIRAAAKNFSDLTVLASKDDYSHLLHLIQTQDATTTLEQRKIYAAKAFEVVMNYDIAISNYFNQKTTVLRYGENPHQQAKFNGDLSKVFIQLNGKELSYNNLVDVDAAIQLQTDFIDEVDALFGIIKHTNVCGVAIRKTVHEAWIAALAGDNESAFGGVLLCNQPIDVDTANAMNDIFFEVLITKKIDEHALEILKQKKNRILLQLTDDFQKHIVPTISKSILNGTIEQDSDIKNIETWSEVGGRTCTDDEKKNLLFANIICKHLKSNAIALIKNKQLVGKGCGQTSRIDALKQAIGKSKQFNVDLKGAVLASDAFFPFDDCVKIAHEHQIEAFIQPGGSIRDKDSIAYCQEQKLAMVITGMRHFKH
jgi:phosphoribosylaminoimidazolecarboxamide formyltransferase / IMP cyclohydrolase